MMNANRSYVFFREIAGAKRRDGPLGAQGVPLTPGRSRWRSTASSCRSARRSGSTPRHPDRQERAALRRLVIAQDTGGAISGPVRGDVFWGWGGRRPSAAGAMRDRGEYYILLPLPAAERVLAQPTS